VPYKGGGGDGAAPSTGTGDAGLANTGGGAGGGGFASGGIRGNGAAGGSGIVITKEAAVNYLAGTSSCWDLRQVFRAVSDGNWTN
jgi:hypothetical protein